MTGYRVRLTFHPETRRPPLRTYTTAETPGAAVVAVARRRRIPLIAVATQKVEAVLLPCGD